MAWKVPLTAAVWFWNGRVRCDWLNSLPLTEPFSVATKTVPFVIVTLKLPFAGFTGKFGAAEKLYKI